jgi:hypothetical protein
VTYDSPFGCNRQALAALSPQPLATLATAAGTPGVTTYDADVLAGGRDLGPSASAFNKYTGEYCYNMVLSNLCAS